MSPRRLDRIRSFIYKNRMVTLDRICEEFEISKSTLRRDLSAILAEDGNIRKIYGGVTVVSQNTLVSFEKRNVEHLEEKKRIAAEAARFVENGDVIFIDSGTTAVHLLQAIKEKENITILTNNIPIIISAIPYANLSVISLSGILDRKTYSFTGASAVQVLRNYNISKAFLAATGFSVANGVANSSTFEAEIKRMAVERSQKIYLLADSSKCGNVALITYCGLEDIDALVTDSPPSQSVCDFMEKEGKQIVIAR